MSYKPCNCGQCDDCQAYAAQAVEESARLERVRTEANAELERIKACSHTNLIRGWLFDECPDCGAMI